MTIALNNNIVLRNKTDLANHIRAGISHNISDAIDGLMTVFCNQLESEVATNSTYYKNRIGFNKSDAKVLTQIAKDKSEGKDLNDEQTSEVQRRMTKYAWQIMNTKIRNGYIAKRNGFYSWN